MRSPAHIALTWLRLACAALWLATGLGAQTLEGTGSPPDGFTWRPSLGVRAGFDYRNQAPSVGALLHLPVPGLPATVTPGGDLVFQDGLTERQVTVDVTVDIGGIQLGGGPVALNSVFTDDGERESKAGYTFLAALRGQAGRLGTELEFRWVRVAELDSRFIMLAFTWTPGAPASPRPF